jgi:hypothetical protein
MGVWSLDAIEKPSKNFNFIKFNQKLYFASEKLDCCEEFVL